MFPRQILRSVAALAPLALVLAACETSTSSEGGRQVAIRMSTAAGASQSVRAQQTGTDQLVLTGDNGVLTLTDVRLVVAEFELDGDDDVNRCQDAGGVDDCEDFDAGPSFVDLPLGSATVTVASGPIPAGTYREVEFEVEDLDDDEENPVERQRIETLLAQIRAQFADWPRKASMLAVGTFQPRNNGVLGQAVPFRVFFEAEIEIELGLSPPLVVADGTSPSVDITLDLAQVFKVGNNVRNLAASNGQLIEFELEIENGFRSGRGGNSGPGGGN